MRDADDPRGKVIRSYTATCAWCANQWTIEARYIDGKWMVYREGAEYMLRNLEGWGIRRGEWHCPVCWVRSQVADTNCGRCKATIPAGDEEFCWYCHAPLCYDCWDEYGHCGHKRADEINAEGMARGRGNG